MVAGLWQCSRSWLLLTWWGFGKILGWQNLEKWIIIGISIQHFLMYTNILNFLDNWICDYWQEILQDHQDQTQSRYPLHPPQPSFGDRLFFESRAVVIRFRVTDRYNLLVGQTLCFFVRLNIWHLISSQAQCINLSVKLGMHSVFRKLPSTEKYSFNRVAGHYEFEINMNVSVMLLRSGWESISLKPTLYREVCYQLIVPFFSHLNPLYSPD